APDVTVLCEWGRYGDRGRLGFERVRGATSLTDRSLQLGLAQRLHVRPPRRERGVVDRLGRDGAGGAARRALPRRRDRDEPVPAAGDRRHGEVEPPYRPRPHGLGGPALHYGYPLRQPGGDRPR